jgi:hypothetical protein
VTLLSYQSGTLQNCIETKAPAAAPFSFWMAPMSDEATGIPEAALRARQMYADGATVDEIVEATGLSHFTLYKWIDGAPQKDGSTLLAPLPRRRMVATRRMLDAERAAVVARLMRSAERQIQDIERRIGTPAGQQESDSRTLAVLARTMRELTALDALNRMSKQPKKSSATNDAGAPKPKPVADEPVPADLEELRRDLSRRLDQLVAEAAAIPDQPPEAE